MDGIGIGISKGEDNRFLEFCSTERSECKSYICMYALCLCLCLCLCLRLRLRLCTHGNLFLEAACAAAFYPGEMASKSSKQASKQAIGLLGNGGCKVNLLNLTHSNHALPALVPAGPAQPESAASFSSYICNTRAPTTVFE
ncbi:hypothetical protein ACMFMF_006272 [Clarireedia jacksonii]